MNDRCSVCGKAGVLYLTQLVGAEDALCKDCLREVSEAAAACVRAMKDRHLLARVAGERHTEPRREEPTRWVWQGEELGADWARPSGSILEQIRAVKKKMLEDA